MNRAETSSPRRDLQSVSISRSQLLVDVRVFHTTGISVRILTIRQLSGALVGRLEGQNMVEGQAVIYGRFDLDPTHSLLSGD
jgi:hypothetical protein